MFGLLTDTRRCLGRSWKFISFTKGNYTNFLWKAPLCSRFFAATTLDTKPTPWTTPNLTLNPQETDPAAEIVFFDLGTTFPKKGEKRQLLEFGAVVVCADTLAEKAYYTFRIRPSLALNYIPNKTRDAEFSTTYSFAEVAPNIFNLLNGRIWAGHNMKVFDANEIRKAFHSIGQSPPVEVEIIDTLPLTRNCFPVKNNKLCTIAKYLNLGEQKHRSLPDALLTRDVLLRAGTLFFLRSKFPVLAPPPCKFLSSQPSKTLRDASSSSKNNSQRRHYEMPLPAQRITQHAELIKQLQSRLELTEGTSIEISAFQSQALEVNENLEIAQQDLFMKVDAIQKYYQAVDLTLKDIYIKEREALSARVKFQEAVSLVPKEDVSNVHRISLSEQIRGDIVLKAWETNIEESKGLARDLILKEMLFLKPLVKLI